MGRHPAETYQERTPLHCSDQIQSSAVVCGVAEECRTLYHVLATVSKHELCGAHLLLL